jgi:hypothetical protein
VYDLVNLRHIHRVTLFAGPSVWLMHWLELPLGSTPAWHRVADVMLKAVQ